MAEDNAGWPTTKQANVMEDVQVPGKSEQDGLAAIDEPEVTEVPDGYGHGV